jgi:uncharacterized protein YegP (UPF0339 family)
MIDVTQIQIISFLAVLYGAFIILIITIVIKANKLKQKNQILETEKIFPIIKDENNSLDCKFDVSTKSDIENLVNKNVNSHTPDGLDYVFNIKYNSSKEGYTFVINDYKDNFLGESMLYKSQMTCLKGMLNMKNFFNLEILDNENSTKKLGFGINVFEIKKDEKSKFYFQIRNLSKTFFISHKFSDKDSCIREIETLKCARFYNYYNEVS